MRISSDCAFTDVEYLVVIMKKYILWSFAAVTGILVLLLSASPTVAEKIAEQQYAEQVSNGDLTIGNIDVNYLTGMVSLENVVAKQSDQSVLNIGKLQLDIDLQRLAQGKLVIQSSVLSDFSVDIDHNPQRVIVAGYEVDLTPHQTKEHEVNESPIKSYALSKLQLNNVKANIISTQPLIDLQAQAIINQLTIEDFDSDKPEQDTDINLALLLEKLLIKQKDKTISVDSGAKLIVKTKANNLLSKPSVSGNIQLQALQLNAALPEQSTDVQLSLNDFKLSDVNLQNVDKLSFNLHAAFGASELLWQKKKVALKQDLSIKANTHITGLIDDPIVKTSLGLNRLGIVLPEIDTQLLYLDSLNLDELSYSTDALSIAGVTLKDVQLAQKGEKPNVLTVDLIELNTVDLPALASVNADKLAITGIKSHIVLDKSRKLPLVEQAKNYLTVSKASESPQKTTQPFAVNLNELKLLGANEIYLKDNGISPAFERNIAIQDLSVDHIHTANPKTFTDFKLKASFSKYSKLVANGRMQLLAKNPTGFVKGKLSGFELVPVSPYAEDATGYIIKTGSTKAHWDVSLKKAELGGSVDVTLNAIKLAPGDKNKMEQLKSQISMPLDTALGLLRDKNGDIELSLPMEGNINDPDFNIANVMGQVSKKVLKKATVAGLKYAFQPYGSMITVGSWLGKKALSVRLDPIQYTAGKIEIDEQKTEYLNKVAEIMQKKDGLRIKLCPYSTPAEQLELTTIARKMNPQAPEVTQEHMLGLAKQRVNIVRDYLVTQQSISSERLLLCQPSFDEASTEKHSFIHLEI